MSPLINSIIIHIHQRRLKQLPRLSLGQAHSLIERNTHCPLFIPFQMLGPFIQRSQHLTINSHLTSFKPQRPMRKQSILSIFSLSRKHRQRITNLSYMLLPTKFPIQLRCHLISHSIAHDHSLLLIRLPFILIEILLLWHSYIPKRSGLLLHTLNPLGVKLITPYRIICIQPLLTSIHHLVNWALRSNKTTISLYCLPIMQIHLAEL